MAALLLLAFSSCKKDKPAAPVADGKLHNVNFTFNAFSVEYANTQTNDLKNNALAIQAIEINEIQVFIYDSKGKLYRESNLRRGTDGSYANISYQLPSGTYTFVFINPNPINGRYYLNKDQLNTGYFYYGGTNVDRGEFRETFYKQLSVTVNNTDVSNTVDLTRVVAGLKIIIKDAIPANVTSLILTIDTVYTAMQIKDGLPFKSDKYVDVAFWDRYYLSAGVSNYTITRQLLSGPNNTISVSLKAQNTRQEIIATKAIRNITINPNKVTVLSGNLFGGNGTNNNAVDVKADTTWSSDILYQSF